MTISVILKDQIDTGTWTMEEIKKTISKVLCALIKWSSFNVAIEVN